jgi:rod shape-determining protein MreD
MAKRVIWAVIFILAASLLQSTLFARLAYHLKAAPDFALDILVFTAYVNGTMTGQLTGFFSGFLLDFLSAAPLGLNALIRTMIGALAGSLKENFFLDFLFLPMALCAGATVLKALSYFVLHYLLAGAVPAYSLLLPAFWVELALNTLLAPFLFALLKLFESLLIGRRKT